MSFELIHLSVSFANLTKVYTMLQFHWQPQTGGLCLFFGGLCDNSTVLVWAVQYEGV